jgi:hypothetical protein
MGKQRFWTSTTNARGSEASGSWREGSAVHARGWNAGVRVWAGRDNRDRDMFTIWMTHGSHEAGSDALIGIVTDTADGPVFTPAAGPDEAAFIAVRRFSSGRVLGSRVMTRDEAEREVTLWRAEIGPAAVAPATDAICAMSDADDSAGLADVLAQLSMPADMRTMPELMAG